MGIEDLVEFGLFFFVCWEEDPCATVHVLVVLEHFLGVNHYLVEGSVNDMDK